MKKLLFFAAGLFSAAAIGQGNDLAITLNSPTANQTLGPGVPFDVIMTINNSGTVNVAANDTMFYAPTLNGGFLTVTGSNGQPVNLVLRRTGAALNAGSSFSDTLSFSGLTISNLNAVTPLDFCAIVVASGPNWAGVQETDTANNESCATVSYDPNTGGMSIAENMVSAEIFNVLDGSYFSGNTYHARVFNLVDDNVTLKFVDLTGRAIYNTELNVANGEVSQEIDLSQFNSGIFLAVLKVNGEVISTKKIVKK